MIQTNKKDDEFLLLEIPQINDFESSLCIENICMETYCVINRIREDSFKNKLKQLISETFGTKYFSYH